MSPEGTIRVVRCPAVLRFVVLAFAALMLTMAVFAAGTSLFGSPSHQELSTRMVGGSLPPRTLVSIWAFEALGLLALFLAVEGRFRSPYLSGLIAGWLGWVFRGPLLVVTVVGALGQPSEPWFHRVVSWWLLYSLCGLVLGGLSRRLRADEAAL